MDNQNTNPATNDTSIDAVKTEAEKATQSTQTVADEAVKTATNKSTASVGVSEERSAHSSQSRDGHCGAGGCGTRRCRVSKWLAIFGLMLASGIIGGMIGGRIGSHGGHDRFDRMPHRGGMMMQQDGMRGGMQGGPMGQGMGQGMQGGSMGQPGAGQQPNPPAPADQGGQVTPPAPTQ